MRELAFLPGNEIPTIQSNGSAILGLLTFRDALAGGIHRFLTDLRADATLRKKAAERYRFLQQHVRD
jgi:hypothetical protein